MPGVYSQRKGRINEKKVAESYRKRGYDVLDLNERGFPDLLVLKDREIQMFIEVKGGAHKVHSWQKQIHKKLEDLGFKIQIERIKK